ncbi:MAG: hypothetical protein WKG01_39180 [Kofleriaceae bacterium]
MANPPDDVKPAPAAKAPEAPKVEPAPPADLQTRIEARRDELVARLTELAADARIEAVEARDKVKRKLSELSHIIKEGVVDGWASINENVKGKLDRWLS